MSLVKVSKNEYEMVTRVKDSNDKWDRDDTHTDHEILGLELVEDERRFYDINTSFQVDPDKSYLLLYAIYSTGDSFGRDEQGEFEAIDLFETHQKDIVNTNIKRIEDPYKMDRNSFNEKYRLSLIHHTGIEYTMYTPWEGYFESLDEVDKQLVRVVKI